VFERTVTDKRFKETRHCSPWTVVIGEIELYGRKAIRSARQHAAAFTPSMRLTARSALKPITANAYPLSELRRRPAIDPMMSNYWTNVPPPPPPPPSPLKNWSLVCGEIRAAGRKTASAGVLFTSCSRHCCSVAIFCGPIVAATDDPHDNQALRRVRAARQSLAHCWFTVLRLRDRLSIFHSVIRRNNHGLHFDIAQG